MPAKINEVGNKYGRLTVLEEAGKDKWGNILWLCQCDCGQTIITRGVDLRRNLVQSCGCFQKERTSIANKKNEMGKKYGRLTVLEQAGFDKSGSAKWKCQCSCGNIKIISGTSLRAGRTKSCGCNKKLPKGIAVYHDKILNMKRNAKARHLDWILSDDETMKFMKQKCYYCGISPMPSKKKQYLTNNFNGDFPSNGLDRIDNKKGYIPNNIVTSCRKCNFMKQAMNVSKFKNQIERIYKYINKKGIREQKIKLDELFLKERRGLKLKLHDIKKCSKSPGIRVGYI